MEVEAITPPCSIVDRRPSATPPQFGGAADTEGKRLVAAMCHEIRNPLSAVLGFAQLLMQDTDPLTARQRNQLHTLERAAAHILGLVEDTLSTSHRKSIPSRGHLDRVELAPVLEDVVEWMTRTAQAADVKIVTQPTSAAVQGDERHVQEVVLNLVSNAVKYNRRGGSVHIAVALNPVLGEVRIDVRDTGRGMTPDQQARLFEPYDRLGAEHEDIQGTGLGLCITRRLIQRMGGSLSISSCPGVGSLFRVTLHAA